MRVPWTVETKSRGTIEVDGLQGWPAYERGEATSVTALIYASGDEVSSGAQYDTTLYDTSANSGVGSPAARYRLLRQYQDYAGAYATGETARSQPWYREQIPPVAPVASQLIALTPPPRLQDNHPGLWGLVAGVTDETTPTESTYRLQLDILVLGERAEFSDHAAVEAALSA